MYLKKIIASGFKSFADKIEIELKEGITGIVGPNGSGKSNVVDAIRWVLGEQSVKSLRGDGNMTDVIFSGSKSRKPMNVASVALVFDNMDHYLPFDYNEVSIQRRVYKDGTNEYSINGEKCRLKDITDLLLDTGIAKESFNIISQGKVDDIISSKPSDRRVIFEEAASVLKYKKRKEEALRKLEKTHDNMNRVNDIINELEGQVNPLKEQREKALIYQEKKKELDSLDQALITTQITNMNFTYQEDKKRIEQLNNEILASETENSTNSAKIEDYKLKISKLENIIALKQEEYTKKIAEVEKINGQKNILLERKKYDVEDTKLHNNLVALKENELKLNAELNKINIELESKKIELNNLNETYKNAENLLKNSRQNSILMDQELNKLLKEKNNIENRIFILKESIENNSLLPIAVKNVISNPKLTGIYDTLGNIIEVEEVYSTAITTSLGAATNNVIVENENKAAIAIEYLKQNHLGRVTFFPLNIIQSRQVQKDILEAIKDLDGFISVASDLVKCHPMYRNIVENQLGNVLVVDNINHANIISNKIRHLYKIVTLDGTLLHVGGSLTGGTLKQNRNVITEKYELENLLKQSEQIENNIKNLENNINEKDHEYKSLEDKFYLLNRNKINIEETITLKENNIDELKQKISEINNEKQGTSSLLDKDFISEETKILEQFYKAKEEKDNLEEELLRLQKNKTDLQESLSEFEFSVRRENSLYNSKSKELKELEIEVNRLDVKLDNLLTELNENYSITYEKAVTIYHLDIEEDEARNRVSNLKKAIKELGNINLDAIEEYDAVKDRYEFLINQRTDLTNAEDTLLEIIKDMDQVMEKEFGETFEKINQKFGETFKELFKGGYAELKMTDPNNLLETGIEIVASPPGKSLKSINLLSGGEKTFTAISLLFAILKSREVPFCILDEVEAALDEANVDGFGEYITKLKEKTQFILITHKKRTMEYADVLYGITMQESGVSKLVSVKLENY
jgi:chromosome segregation protein